MTSLHVIAHTTHDGPVVLRSCETEREQRRAYRDAVATLRDGGFDGDVTGIELRSSESGHVTPATDQALIQGRLL